MIERFGRFARCYRSVTTVQKLYNHYDYDLRWLAITDFDGTVPPLSKFIHFIQKRHIFDLTSKSKG